MSNPKNCAVVDTATNIVTNIIVADPAINPAPKGCILVRLTDDSPVSFGWIYNPSTGQFTEPSQ